MIRSQPAENSRGCERALQAADLCIICALSTARSRSSPGVFLGPLASDPFPKEFHAYILCFVLGLGAALPSTFHKCHNHDGHYC